MSAARSPHRDPPAGTAAGQHVGSTAAREPVRRRLLAATFVLAVGWSLALFCMDVWTTGRPVVGPGQVLKADVVVIATRIAADSDRIKIERTFKGDVSVKDTLRVLNLTDVPRLAAGQEYLFALSRFRNDFEVTKLDGQRGELLVYPVSAATIEQTKAILRDDPGR